MGVKKEYIYLFLKGKEQTVYKSKCYFYEIKKSAYFITSLH